jgi:phospholipid N-methyltransferase
LALGATALGAVLATSSAQAQQVISRTINEEPVETVVTQTPNGTVITRRPLGTAVAPAPMTIVETPYRAPATIVETVPDTVDAVTTRDVVRRLESRPVRLTTQTTKVRKSAKVVRDYPPERVVTRVVREPVAERVVTRTVRAPVPVIALSPAERRIVYQTIVEREVVPAPRVVAPAWREPAWRDQAWRDPAYAPVMAADDDDIEMTRPSYAVGAVLPGGVPLFAVPQEVAYRVPAARPYSYAYVGGRAYLVDPVSSVIVADVTE